MPCAGGWEKSTIRGLWRDAIDAKSFDIAEAIGLIRAVFADLLRATDAPFQGKSLCNAATMKSLASFLDVRKMVPTILTWG